MQLPPVPIRRRPPLQVHLSCWWVDPAHAGFLPSVPGIYAFVAYPPGGPSKAADVLYIGQAEGLFERLSGLGHHRLDAAGDLAQDSGRHLLFALLEVEGGPDLKMRLDAIEQALIFNKKPPLNTLHKAAYKGRHIVLTIEGAEGILPARLNLAPAPIAVPVPPLFGVTPRLSLPAAPSPALLGIEAALGRQPLGPLLPPSGDPLNNWWERYLST